MREFKDKIAVITGAASGIGYGLAERCAQEGMKVVLADIEENALDLAERHLREMGASTLVVPTDVSKANDVEALAEKVLNTFGAVHLLCNNAGVGTSSTTWGSTLADWEWVLGVNLWGVIHGIHVFVPIMLEQGNECHIVNTASVAGLITGASSGVYATTKHGIIALSETLYRELEQRGSSIGVSVLCPGFTKTRIMESGRNRPEELQNDTTEEQRNLSDPIVQTLEYTITRMVSKGIPVQQVAELVMSAIRDEKFYILVNADPFKPLMQMRMKDILQERNPTNVVLDLRRATSSMGSTS
jgi:NAD(P)-dependent dehydrogenase (short-subunit alcohol dehydrogenase family)